MCDSYFGLFDVPTLKPNMRVFKYLHVRNMKNMDIMGMIWQTPLSNINEMSLRFSYFRVCKISRGRFLRMILYELTHDWPKSLIIQQIFGKQSDLAQ